MVSKDLTVLGIEGPVAGSGGGGGGGGGGGIFVLCGDEWLLIDRSNAIFGGGGGEENFALFAQVVSWVSCNSGARLCDC